MTVDIATLAIRIDSIEARNAARDLDRMRDSGGRAEQSTNALTSATRGLSSALALLGIGAGVASIISMVDAYAKFTAQLRLASTSTREYAAAYADVKRIANSAQVDMAATGVLYARIANGTRELGTTQKQVAAITETVNLALMVSGATATEAASAQLQLSQAFASGTLRGEEFNAVNEAAPRLMLALADGIGVPVGALKKMAGEGLITSKIMADVLPKALQQVREEAKQIQTIAGSFTVLKNSLMEFVGIQASASGVVSILNSGIVGLANNLDLVAGAVITLSLARLGSIMSDWVVKTYDSVAASRARIAADLELRATTLAAAQAELARADAAVVGATASRAALIVTQEAAVANLADANSRIVSARAAMAAAEAAGALSFALRTLKLATAELAVAETLRAAYLVESAALDRAKVAASAQITAALVAQTAAQTALNGASAGGVAAASMASRVIGALGGPVGAIITLLGIAATAWMVWGNKAKEATDLAKESAIESADAIIKTLDKQIARHEAIINLRKQGLTLDEAKKIDMKPRETLGALSTDLSALNNGSGKYASMSNDDKFFERQKILEKILELTTQIKKEETKGKEANGYTQAEAHAKFMLDYATKLEQADAKVAEGRKLLGAAFTAEDEARVRKAFAEPDKGAAAANKADLTASLDLIKFGTETAKALRMEGLAKTAEMNRQGLASDAQLYAAKHAAALAAGADAAKIMDAEIAELTKHHSKAGAEQVANNGKIAKLGLEKNEALRAAAAAAEAIRVQYEYDKDAPHRAAEDASVKEIANINAEIAAVEMQIRTYNMLPAAKTAVLIADLEQQKAARVTFANDEESIANDAKAIALMDEKIARLTQLKTVQAAQTAQDTGSDVAKAKELLDILTAVDAATKSAASGMAESFGAVGKAIGGLTTALSGYAVQQQAITAKLAADKADPKNAGKFAELEAAASKASAQAQIKNYGDMAGAAKGFFKENSAGYKVMEGAEKAFRAVEMAMAIESMVKKLFTVTTVTTATVGGEAAKVAAVEAGTAAQLASDTVKGVSAAGVAVATQAQGDPYSAWIRMAAMAAAMAALGFAVSGGSGANTTAKDRQAANGTGTVLGDDTAKSESIANSLKLVEDNTYRDMEISGAMLASLRNIETSLGGLGNLVARVGALDGKAVNEAAGTGTAFKTSDLISTAGWLAPILALTSKIPVLGGIVAKLFGTTKSVTDYGITAGPATLGSIQQDGFQGQTYADIETKKKTFGLTYSTKTKTDLADLDVGIERQFGLVINSLADGVSQAVGVLGIGGAEFTARMQTFIVDLGDISFKDLKRDERQAALEAAFGAVGDKMAAFAIDEVVNFAKVGEGAFETLTRLANDYATVDAVLGSFGDSFGMVGFASVEARERLIALSGGLDKFATQGAFFLENFFTDKEKAGTLRTSVNSVLTPLNGGVDVKTYDQFKQLALAQDLTTESGARTYATIMGVAQAFQKLTEYGDENGKKILSAQQILDQGTTLQEKYNQLTMTSAQLRAIERGTIDDANLALYDGVQAAQTAITARAMEIQIMELSGDKAGTLAAKRKDELAGIDATLQPQQLRIYALEDEATALGNTNAILGYQAQIAEATKDKVGAATISQEQFNLTLANMTPEVAAWAVAARAAQKAQKDANDAAATHNSILGFQAQYTATIGDKIGAANVAQEQFNASLKDMTPEVARWATIAHNAAVAQGIVNDGIEENNKILGFQMTRYEALGDKLGIAATAQKQFEASLIGLTPALKAAATAAHDATEESKTKATALADANTILQLQADMYTANGDVAGLAAVVQKQHDAALKLITNPAVAKQMEETWAAQAAEKARATATTEQTAILSAQMSMYEAMGNKAKIAETLEKQHVLALGDMTAGVADATKKMWAAQAAEKIKSDALAESNTLLDLQAQQYEATGSKLEAATVLQKQHAAALLLLTPAVAKQTQATWDAQAAAKAAADALAEHNSVLDLQGQIYEASGDTAMLAGVKYQQHLEAMKLLSPVLANLTNALFYAKQAAEEKAKADEAAAKVAAIAQQQRGLDIQLMEATGNAVGALAAKRKDELAGLDSSLRATQQAIYAAQDAATAVTDAASASDAALDALNKSITAQQQAQQEAVTSIKSVFDLLTSEAEKLYGSVSSTAEMSAKVGVEFIANALAKAKATGALPDVTALGKASTAAQAGIGEGMMQVDADYRRLVLAGQLQQLADIAGPQLTEAEKQLASTDGILKTAQSQLDTLRGISANTLSVADAVEALQVAMTGEKTARQVAADLAKAAAGAGAGAAGGGSSDWKTANNAAYEVWHNTQQIANLQSQIAAGGNAAVIAGLATTLGALQASTAASVALAQTSGTFAAGVATIEAAMQAGTGQAYASIVGTNSNTTVAGAVLSAASLPSFDVGINRVPYDMVAQIHEDELIVPAAFNPFNPNARFGSAVGSRDPARLEALVEGLTAKVQDLTEQLSERLDESNRNTRRTADATNGNPDQPVPVAILEDETV